MNSKETNIKGVSEEVNVEQVEGSEVDDGDDNKNERSKIAKENGVVNDDHKYVNNNTCSVERENVEYNMDSYFVMSNNTQRSKLMENNSNCKDMGASQSKYKYSSSTNMNPMSFHNLTTISSNSSVQSNLVNTCTNIDTSLSSITSGTISKSNSNESHEDMDMINNVDYNCKINKCPPKVSCSSSTTPDLDLTWSQASCTSDCALNNIGANIGSTSQGTCGFLRPNINGNCTSPGPSGLSKMVKQNDRRDSSSGNEGEDFSDGEDCCIYTYKGNNESNDVRAQCNSGNLDHRETCGLQNSGRSSPEMDFLEMDFDPGPSCEQDTGDSDLASINEDIQNLALDNIDSDAVFLNDLSSGKVVSRQSTHSPQAQSKPNVSIDVKSNDNDEMRSSSNSTANNNQAAQCLPAASTSSATQKLSSQQSYYNNAGIPSRESHGYHNTSGDLISPGDNRDTDSELWVDAAAVPLPENSTLQWLKVNLSSTLWHRMMAKKLMLQKQTTFSQSEESKKKNENELSNDNVDARPVERLMLWTEQDAAMKQVTQIATSACGATSAVNALLALDVPFSPEILVKGVATRLREPGTPLPRYLLSRSAAGATHKDIIRGLDLATNGAVISKFFSFYPERAISLSHWLHYWISRGAAPIATLNLQNCRKGCKIPDAWHHQMIFGVSQAGIYFTNPLECLPERLVWHQLVSPSILLIRRADVLAHWNSTTDLYPLMKMDHRWRRLNVLGQVVNMIRESSGQCRQPLTGSSGSTHIRIPASYQAGITLVMRSDASAAEELLNADQLPLI